VLRSVFRIIDHNFLTNLFEGPFPRINLCGGLASPSKNRPFLISPYYFYNSKECKYVEAEVFYCCGRCPGHSFLNILEYHIDRPIRIYTNIPHFYSLFLLIFTYFFSGTRGLLLININCFDFFKRHQKVLKRVTALIQKDISECVTCATFNSPFGFFNWSDHGKKSAG
jgi:hypothetical protein